MEQPNPHEDRHREILANLAAIQKKLNRLVEFCDRAEAEFDRFKVKGIFGMMRR